MALLSMSFLQWSMAKTEHTNAMSLKKDTQIFCLTTMLKEERLKARLTQQQLAERIGTKKTYISRLENGKADVKLSTLFRIFEGLGRRVSLTIL